MRFPAVLAALALLFGPAAAWGLRAQRRHLAATTFIAFTAAAFLVAAHLAFARFAPILSSQSFVPTIQQLCNKQSCAQTTLAIFGDQAFGSSLPFYLGRSRSTRRRQIYLHALSAAPSRTPQTVSS